VGAKGRGIFKKEEGRGRIHQGAHAGAEGYRLEAWGPHPRPGFFKRGIAPFVRTRKEGRGDPSCFVSRDSEKKGDGEHGSPPEGHSPGEPSPSGDPGGLLPQGLSGSG